MFSNGFAATAALLTASTIASGAPVDLSGYSKQSGVDVRAEGDEIRVEWPAGGGETAFVRLDLRSANPLIGEVALVRDAKERCTLLTNAEPTFSVIVGSRRAPEGRPPDMSVFNVFFDNPATRPHLTHAVRLELSSAAVKSRGRRVDVELGGLTAGPFAGELVFSFWADASFFRVEARAATREDLQAFTYSGGLVGFGEPPGRAAWRDVRQGLSGADLREAAELRPVQVRHRAIVLEGSGGSVSLFPPPHQFFFPRDWTDNLSTVWYGAAAQPLRSSGRSTWGAGVRQPETGGGSFVPWFNAPPNTLQRMSFYCLLQRGAAEDALRETLRWTRGDRFPELPGHVTFTSHWHMAIAVASMARKPGAASETPDFVGMFKEMGVNIVHLAEFHGDGHQFDPGPLRISELEAMFRECRRLSDERLLFIPGEEINTYLGLPAPGRHPGHWMSLFPAPVRFILKREEGQPWVEQDASLGRVYRVGSRADMLQLLEKENGLAWSAHPRIKASSWAPDIFRKEDFYLSERWLGAAWKAMPADLSRPKLGERALDLLDDMCNWGQRKYLPGEVDVFQLNATHELYGHMNVNYLRLDRVPRFDEGWQPVLDALRGGQFFVTTGEVLIRDLRVGGQRSGGTLRLPADGRTTLAASMEWTFPLERAEVISGDGAKVDRKTIDLTDLPPCSSRTLEIPLELRGRKWVRFEVWDSAANGAFTQPIWIEDSKLGN